MRTLSVRELLQLTWSRLRIVAEIVGDIEARAIATIFYCSILVPFGLLARFTTDPLQNKYRKDDSFWLARPAVENDIEAAKRQG